MKLWNYIKGSREGKEANRIEKDAMKDPFLADALEGFDLVKGNHIKNMGRLRKQVKTKSTGKNPTNFRVLGIVAAILITVGAGAFFLTQNIDMSSKEDEVAKVDVQSAEVPEHEIFALKDDPSSSTPVFEEDQTSESAGEIMMPQKKLSPVNDPEIRKKAIDSDLDEEKPVIVNIISEEEPVAADTRAKKKSEIEPQKDTVSKKRAVLPKSTDKKTESLIRGWVTDANGQPLVGASIFLSGTKKATVSDANGYFELSSKKPQKIQVNYLGYESVTLLAELSKMTLVILSKNNDEDDGIANNKTQTTTETIRKPVPVKGEAAYNNYLKENLRHPTDECKDIKGEVVVAFYIDSSGKPYKIRIVKGVCSSIDREAIRLVRRGPLWKQSDAEATVTINF